MRKTKKNIFGLLGLVSVVAITAFAATLPGPKASATTSVTDTLSIRVVGSVPMVDILGIDNGEIITVPEQAFTVEYENVETLTVTLTHTDLDGNETVYPLDDLMPDYYPGAEEYNIHFIK